MSAVRPPPVIDHHFFPHIVESIIAYASPNVLCAFGDTCRKYRAFVVPFQCRHIGVYINKKSPLEEDYVIFLTPDGRRRLHGVVWRVSPCRQLLKHTRIVEYLGPREVMVSQNWVLEAAFDNLEVLRLPADAARHWTNVVAYKAWRAVHFVDTTSDIQLQHMFRMPPNVPTLIFSVIFNPGEAGLGRTRLVLPQQGCEKYVRELIIIFSPHKRHFPSSPSPFVEEPLGVLTSLCVCMAMLEPDLSYTFVGLETLPHSAFALPPDALRPHRFEAAIKAEMAILAHNVRTSERPIHLDHEPCVCLPSSITFMSRDEYRASIGETRWRLDTCPPTIPRPRQKAAS